MYEHNALGYWSGLALCLTKVRSSRARCPATALIVSSFHVCLSEMVYVKHHHIKINKIHNRRFVRLLVKCLYKVQELHTTNYIDN